MENLYGYLTFAAAWCPFTIVATAIGYQKRKLISCCLCGIILGPIGMLYAIWIREKGKNCPHCGEYLNIHRISCPDCGYGYPAQKDYQI